jgi:hypothetical protein
VDCPTPAHEEPRLPGSIARKARGLAGRHGEPINARPTNCTISLTLLGKEEIRGGAINNGGDFLTPIMLRLPETNAILDAKLVSVTRPEIGFTITNISANLILLNWTILEYKDGGLIQIAYEGTTSAPFQLEGSVTKQKSFKHVPVKQSNDYSLTILLVLSQVVSSVALVCVLIKDKVPIITMRKIFKGALVVTCVCMSISILVVINMWAQLYNAKLYATPFGF